ncbi:uncharacterized protein EV420DRAFT_1498776 [Desarmillaria tabescens]|uniref:DUF6534 domain-containing protein n=1 Tax=Armillaria tabescens TaxID=1929756 RepID=A0AA39TU27_ARMTA|nr:uncharacterized protein EV420DRAFT_1498776 [Desarmillaria tabescens]KAK0470172.1 hypothetical protein EV420DRAFT_1498776 [Desarmillaria tabescens]
MSTDSLTLFSMGTTLGAVLIGATLASALFGVTTMLFFVYYKRYSQDRWFYRISLAILWVFDALHFALALHILYFYLVDSFGDSPALLNMVWSFKLDFSTHLAILMGVDIVCVVRLWILGRFFHRIVPWIVSFTVAGVVAVLIFLIYEVYTISSFHQFSDISKIMDGALAVGAAADLAICLATSYYLYKSKAVTISSRTSGPLLVLMRLVLISGLAKTAASILMLVVFLTFPNTLIFVAIGFPIPRLYIITLLTMLNAWTPRPGDRCGHANFCLPLKTNEMSNLPLNFSDVTVVDEQLMVGWSLHDQPGGSPNI